LLYYRVPVAPLDLLLLPFVIVVQLVFTVGLALLASALTVLFRDVRDLLANLLTVWFFGTPIIYPITQVPASVRWLLNLNPMTHLAVAYQEVLFRPGTFGEWWRVGLVGIISVFVFAFGYFVFDRLRDRFPEEV
jgi:ABC-type polysaccharide/polyol phosphate export permease